MMEYTQRMTNSVLKDVQDKVYNTLKQIAGRHGRITNLGLEIDCYLSHEDIGFLVTASLVSVTRSINQLIEMGKLKKTIDIILYIRKSVACYTKNSLV